MSKYKNRKVEYDGYTFDSVKEYRRYLELKKKLNDGLIRHLQLQVPFELIPAQKDERGKLIERACVYIADFVYYENETDKMIVEDVKGVKTKEYRIKKKLLLYRYSLRISEV